MPGFSDGLIETHLALYEGYVSNVNKLKEMLVDLSKDVPQYSEMKRRLGWEWNGMRLHEYYFENLGGDGKINAEGELFQALVGEFGSYEKWKEDFVGTGKMRGIGWAVLYKDRQSGNLINFWINEHDTGHPAGESPILVMDVFEHAYFMDYGKDKPKYIESFFANVDWRRVEERFE